LVGDGPDREQLQAQIARLGLTQSIAFTGAMPARQALTFGRVMVVPSRAESLPYVVLETAAAGKPLITTKVGGIPEIYGPLTDTLTPAENSGALAEAIARVLDQPDETAKIAANLRERVAAAFSVETMVDGVLAAYGEGLETLSKTGRR
jgi:glycosyltransferase involved in cell wall biosynthesis